MKSILLLVLASVFAVQVLAQIDVDTPELRTLRTRYEAMRNAAQQEAEKMNSVDIHNELPESVTNHPSDRFQVAV